MSEIEIKANKGKKLIVEVDGVTFMRIPIRTNIISPNDELNSILDVYVRDFLIPGDLLFIA